jgi:uncharacterized protein
VKSWLVDAGPLIAYLDPKDPQHEAVAVCLESFPGQLLTTAAVVTEAMYFLSDIPNGVLTLGELLVSSQTFISESVQPKHVLEAAKLMAKYADIPMDFADATLVLLAEEAGVTEILTLDRRGFSSFRTSRGKPFRMTLE